MRMLHPCSRAQCQADRKAYEIVGFHPKAFLGEADAEVPEPVRAETGRNAVVETSPGVIEDGGITLARFGARADCYEEDVSSRFARAEANGAPDSGRIDVTRSVNARLFSERPPQPMADTIRQGLQRAARMAGILRQAVERHGVAIALADRACRQTGAVAPEDPTARRGAGLVLESLGFLAVSPVVAVVVDGGNQIEGFPARMQELTTQSHVLRLRSEVMPRAFAAEHPWRHVLDMILCRPIITSMVFI